MPLDRPQRVTLPTLQILAAFMADLSRDDWYGRALSVHTGLGSGSVLQCLYRLENWGWLKSRWEDRNVAIADGRPPRRFYCLTGVGQRQATALLAERCKGQLRPFRAVRFRPGLCGPRRARPASGRRCSASRTCC
jgi:PadR family transcriptional regulator, regulatory protein PadR